MKLSIAAVALIYAAAFAVVNNAAVAIINFAAVAGINVTVVVLMNDRLSTRVELMKENQRSIFLVVLDFDL